MTSTSRAKSLIGSVTGLARGDRPQTRGYHKRNNDKVKVEYYYRNKYKLRFFLTQLRATFALNRSKYPDTKSQVLYTVL